MISSTFIDPSLGDPAFRPRAELRRMRLLATGLLVAMLALFLASWSLEAGLPIMAYLRAFSEAALVGACADWFAVVALFRHPFGIPVPHTAVVPRHKTQIGESFGRFVSNNFLAREAVTARLRSVDAAHWLARWLQEPGNVALVAKSLHGVLPSLTSLLGEEQIRIFSRGLIRNGIDSIAAAPLVAKVLAVLIQHGHHEAVFDVAIERLRTFLIDHKDNIRERVSKDSAGWLPTWVDAKVTDAYLAEFLATLSATRASDHPWRSLYRKSLKQMVARLAEDEKLLDYGEQIKTEVLDNAVVDGYLAWLGDEAEARLQAELAGADGVVASGLENSLLVLGNWLKEDAQIHDIFNRWVQQIILNTVVPNRAEIGAFVAEVVARWDTPTLVDKLELQVGTDLQYIRINGTIVGGLVGLSIFAGTQLLSLH
jgi:uncharacterized membrane-anchored protein YjiN (DUF445 family)